MKVYFIGSPRAVVKEPELYKKIYKYLAKDNEMLNDLIWRWATEGTEGFYDVPHKDIVKHYKKMMACIKSADLTIMEVSEHSLSMGYIANETMELAKPIIALHKKGHEPFFFRGVEDPKMQIIEYDESNILKMLDWAMEQAKNVSDVRFNFFISPKMLVYLNTIARKKSIPRSVYIRHLIDEDMKKNGSLFEDKEK